MENMDKSDIRIGPEINIDNVDKIENHSSFICLKCNKKVYIQNFLKCSNLQGVPKKNVTFVRLVYQP